MPFGIQPWHLIVVVIVALVIFGPSRLPQLGRSMGAFFRDLRAGARDMSNGFKEGVKEVEGANQSAAQSITDAKGPTVNQEAVHEPKPRSIVESGSAGTAVFCTACGASNPSDAKFCKSCGKQIA